MTYNTEDFIAYLRDKDYAERYIEKIQYGLRYVREKHGKADLLTKISDISFSRKTSRLLKKRYGDDIAKLALSSLRRLREYLIATEVIEDVPLYRTSGYFQKIEKKLQTFVLTEKNYAEAHVKRIIAEYYQLTEFLISRGKDNFSNVDQEDIFEYFKHRKPNRTYASCLRVVLSFLFREGCIFKDFSPIILCSKQKDNEVRKFLPPEDIERLLAGASRNTLLEKRNYLVFLLMARLALRGTEILRLKLDDIEWEKSRIFIRGKHERLTTLPFSQEVGDAIFDYLQEAGRGSDDELILSVMPPYKKMGSTNEFNKALRDLYKKCGVTCPTRHCRLNVFRHSLATERLNAGVPMMAVRDLLRHDSVNTTMVYAKYNLPALSNLAVDWPGAVQ